MRFYDRLKIDFQERIGDRTIEQWGLHLSSLNDFSFQVNHTGTIFKLYSLYEYLIYPYLSIMPTQRHLFPPYKMLYVDLFAGNGLNQVNHKGKRYFICGSPILAILASYRMSKRRKKYHCYFDDMILIEEDPSSSSVLEDRCKEIISTLKISNNLSVDYGFTSKSNVKIIEGNMNDLIFLSTLLSYLNSIQANNKIHLMLFVDPPNPSSIDLSVLKQILSCPSDVIILLHSGIFATQVKKRFYLPQTLQKILDISHEEATELLTSRYSHDSLEQYYTTAYEKAIKV